MFLSPIPIFSPLKVWIRNIGVRVRVRVK